MNFKSIYFWGILILLSSCSDPKSQIEIDGLKDKVEVFRDSIGINHIFAQNEHDLFFAQGYLAAKDRLFQFEIWRRQATGTLAEILGERELKRDIGVRLFKFRGEKSKELNHYHPRGEMIVDAFVDGVNQYISEARSNPENLPIEFQMLGILPAPWTWEVVISRHQGLLGNSTNELNFSRIVSLIGAEETKKYFNFHPNDPILDLDPSIPKELLFKDILGPYRAFRNSVDFYPEDIKPEFRKEEKAFQEALSFLKEEKDLTERSDEFANGSNNWVISGSKTDSGYPFMANDPHRSQAVPSLRYWVHLNAPGWNVIGGGEPEIPGVSIGHNDFGAWGLTIFSTDFEDIRVYELNPADSNQYFYKGEWVNFKIEYDTIQVKGKDPVPVRHLYTIHGPLTFVDKELGKAVAMQCAWLEPGAAPYLASLSMGQAKNWEEFRAACTLNFVPGENMIWADRAGNIGWQATGVPPIRRDYSGLVATLGDGSKDWDGYLPIAEKPNEYNPDRGFIATANQNVAPENYPFGEALGYEWADDFRAKRIQEVLSQNKKFTIEEMGSLQNDYLSLPARRLIPYLGEISLEDPKADSLRKVLLKWDFVLDKNSIPASVYVMWERSLRNQASKLFVPEKIRSLVGSLSMTRVIQWAENPSLIISKEAEEKRNNWLKSSFEETISLLKNKLGNDISAWQYGQEAYKHAIIRHPLSAAVSSEWEKKLNHGPVPRGGYSYTPGANSYGDNNSSGASFRIIVDTGDWDKTKGINSPGQSGNPESPFYGNLFPIWAEDKYLTIPFKKEKIKKSSLERNLLSPRSK